MSCILIRGRRIWMNATSTIWYTIHSWAKRSNVVQRFRAWVTRKVMVLDCARTSKKPCTSKHRLPLQLSLLSYGWNRFRGSKMRKIQCRITLSDVGPDLHCQTPENAMPHHAFEFLDTRDDTPMLWFCPPSSRQNTCLPSWPKYTNQNKTTSYSISGKLAWP